MNTFVAIDLSQLPAPQVVEQIDYEQILTERKAYAISLWPSEEQAEIAARLNMESEPLTKLIEENAYREMVWRQRVNEASVANMLALAKGADLENLAANYNVKRLVIDPARSLDTRMIVFNCWTGLSLSELIALAAEDVDLVAGVVHVRRASVVGEFKVPKERTRLRVVELIDPALDLMREIVAAAKEAPCEEIKVIQRDNISIKKQKVQFLFRSSTSGLLWNGRMVSIWFTEHLKKAGVRHRGRISVGILLLVRCCRVMCRWNGLLGSWGMRIRRWLGSTMDGGFLMTPRAWLEWCLRCWGSGSNHGVVEPHDTSILPLVCIDLTTIFVILIDNPESITTLPIGANRR